MSQEHDYQVTLPKLGESIVSATIVQWFKKEGDSVNLDEPLLEVSTDKVNSEIPAPASGVITSIKAPVDQELQVGDLLAVIRINANSHNDIVALTPQKQQTSSTSDDMKDVFSPALLRLAKEHNISLEELEKIPATGGDGRLTKRDVELYLESKKSPQKSCPLKQTNASDVERVKMSGMRKAIADNMVRSFYEAPHATLITEVDVTNIVKLIQKEKEAFLAKNGVKLTITAFAARAIAKALREYPLINSSLEGDTICVKRFVNIGIAVSVDQGILVPVVKNCQTISFTEMAKTIGDLSLRARASTLLPHEVQEGTITLTNFGISGVQIGIPIIRHGEVAIVGMGAIHKKVVVLDDDILGVRSMMHLSLTFDHRVLDGMYGCGFLNSLKEHLEKEQSL